MTRIRRQHGRLVLRLAEYELALLTSLTEQLIGLLEAEQVEPVSEDPLDVWEAELSGGQLDQSDPVIARLFPPAYRDDPLAQAEFRRYTENAQRRTKAEQAQVVLDALESADPSERRVAIEASQTEAWLKTLAALRLSLAVRLGIQEAADIDELEALDADDPRAFVYNVYEWLGYFLETLLAAL